MVLGTGIVARYCGCDCRTAYSAKYHDTSTVVYNKHGHLRVCNGILCFCNCGKMT